MIARKDRHLSPHKPSPENTALLQGRKSREKSHSLSAMTFARNTQSDKAHPIEEAQLSVEENPATTCTDELENDCRSPENKMQSETAKTPPAWERTTKQSQRRVSKPKAAEELRKGQSSWENSNVSNTGQDKLQINSKRNMKDCEEVRNEPNPKKQKPALGK